MAEKIVNKELYIEFERKTHEERVSDLLTLVKSNWRTNFELDIATEQIFSDEDFLSLDTVPGFRVALKEVVDIALEVFISEDDGYYDWIIAAYLS